jgi:hypothetical protein
MLDDTLLLARPRGRVHPGASAILAERARLAGSMVLTVGLALLLTRTAASSASKVIAKATNSKGLIAVATGTAKAPIGHLSFTVETTPAQNVTIDWSLLCQTGVATNPEVGAPTARSEGSFKARAPFTHPLTLPAARPKNCVVTVYSILSTKAKETLELVQG